MPATLRGAALARRYSAEVVEPLLERLAPGVPFSTARLGSGSDVLALDDAVSRDHDWGLRLTLVAPEEELARLDDLLERHLPATFLGLPTRFATTWEPLVRQRVEATSAVALARSRSGIDGRPRSLLDWTSLTGQAALEVVGGPVFRDDGRALGLLRDRFAAYPEDVRRWAVASGWAKLAQELPFVGRIADRGDEPGSRAVAARLSLGAIRLAFLLERRWAPYAKWLGTAFAALPVAAAVGPFLSDSARAGSWQEREAGLVGALERLARRQGADGLPSLDPVTEPFWDRPYRGVRDLAAIVRDSIEEPVLRGAPLIGTPEQWTDDVPLLTDHRLRRAAVAAMLGLPEEPARPSAG